MDSLKSLHWWSLFINTYLPFSFWYGCYCLITFPMSGLNSHLTWSRHLLFLSDFRGKYPVFLCCDFRFFLEAFGKLNLPLSYSAERFLNIYIYILKGCWTFSNALLFIEILRAVFFLFVNLLDYSDWLFNESVAQTPPSQDKHFLT